VRKLIDIIEENEELKLMLGAMNLLGTILSLCKDDVLSQILEEENFQRIIDKLVYHENDQIGESAI